LGKTEPVAMGMFVLSDAGDGNEILGFSVTTSRLSPFLFLGSRVKIKKIIIIARIANKFFLPIHV
jgi:hypothetical protein